MYGCIEAWMRIELINSWRNSKPEKKSVSLSIIEYCRSSASSSCTYPWSMLSACEDAAAEPSCHNPSNRTSVACYGGKPSPPLLPCSFALFFLWLSELWLELRLRSWRTSTEPVFPYSLIASQTFMGGKLSTARRIFRATSSQWNSSSFGVQEKNPRRSLLSGWRKLLGRTSMNHPECSLDIFRSLLSFMRNQWSFSLPWRLWCLQPILAWGVCVSRDGGTSWMANLLAHTPRWYQVWLGCHGHWYVEATFWKTCRSLLLFHPKLFSWVAVASLSKSFCHLRLVRIELIYWYVQKFALFGVLHLAFRSVLAALINIAKHVHLIQTC